MPSWPPALSSSSTAQSQARTATETSTQDRSTASDPTRRHRPPTAENRLRSPIVHPITAGRLRSHVRCAPPGAPTSTCVFAGGGPALESQVRYLWEPRLYSTLFAANAQVERLPGTNRQQPRTGKPGRHGIQYGSLSPRSSSELNSADTALACSAAIRSPRAAPVFLVANVDGALRVCRWVDVGGGPCAEQCHRVG